jgi:hypothetical protein
LNYELEQAVIIMGCKHASHAGEHMMAAARAASTSGLLPVLTAVMAGLGLGEVGVGVVTQVVMEGVAGEGREVAVDS